MNIFLWLNLHFRSWVNLDVRTVVVNLMPAIDGVGIALVECDAVAHV